jgi:hypothetical protein
MSFSPAATLHKSNLSPGPTPARRVLVHGLPVFGKAFANLMRGDGWEFRYYPDKGIKNLGAMVRDLRTCHLAYQIGGRVTFGKFLHAAKLLGKEKLIIHWIGSDTLRSRKDVDAGKAQSWITKNLLHWAESEWLAEEVRAMGIPCEWVPLPAAFVPERPMPLPADFSVLVYMPDVSRGNLYGLDRILEVARALPKIPFELVGLLNGTIPDAPSNLHVHGRIKDMSEFYRRATIFWRPVRHDGLSHMVLEALGYGRHVIWTYPFPGSRLAETANDARNHIESLYFLHLRNELRINEAGVQAIAGRFLPNQLKRETLNRLEAFLDS